MQHKRSMKNTKNTKTTKASRLRIMRETLRRLDGVELLTAVGGKKEKDPDEPRECTATPYARTFTD